LGQLIFEGALLNTELCVLLPVYNAQERLHLGVAHILEILPEWADRFELCIIDDGSQDDTAEISRDLATLYPQLRVIRHPVRLGLAEAIQSGLDHTEGEMILVGNDNYELDPEDLRMLWKLRDTERRLRRREEAGWSPTDPNRTGGASGFEMIRRTTFEQFRLQQAVEMIARIDAADAPDKQLTARPNFLAPLRRFIRSE
jgi:glycosyltransferase involved in cell wall biosynthesis